MNTATFDPEDRAVFAFGPGRYYVAMWFCNLPVGGQGGDITALLWRKDDEPVKWTMQWRFRYYKSDKIWGSGDRKRWGYAELVGPESEVTAKAELTWASLAMHAGRKLHKLAIEGDSAAFFTAVKRDKPDWLHVGIPDAEAAKGGDAKEN